MRLLVDMNLGAANATEDSIMRFATEHKFTVHTHDLDFGAILAATHAHGPSVIQIRTQDVLTAEFANTLLEILSRFETDLTSGALIVLDESRARVRILPVG